MTRMILALVLLGITGAVAVDRVQADVLLIEEVRQSDRMDLPQNGATMAEVRAKFGEPVSAAPAVGQPPITRWNYDQWSVYFEYDRVLYSVLHKGAVIDKSKQGG